MFLLFVVKFVVTAIAMKIVHNMQRMPVILVTSATILMVILTTTLHATNHFGELRMVDKMLQYSDMGIHLLREIIIPDKGITIKNSRTTINIL
ncbi:hypothetical protein Gogos_011951, partial [Gossypium gossypioides]|nr:hypothetical protein [Gossypium gossypioides]